MWDVHALFTPIEAASVGIFLTFVVAAWLRALTAQAFREVILQTMRATATNFVIIIGAFFPVMSMTDLPAQLVSILTSLPVGEVGVLFLIILAYIFWARC